MITPTLRHADPRRLLADVLGGDVSAATLSFAEELAIRRWCRQNALSSAANIRRLHQRGHRKNARRERVEHLRRQAVLVDALFVAARKRWPVKSAHLQARREAQRQQRLISVFAQVGKVGKFHRAARGRQFEIMKRDGGTRRVTSFDWVDRARQHVLKSALHPFASFHDGQFMHAHDKGRRGPAAVRKALLAALDGCCEDSLFMQFDVVDFYGSISHDWLERQLGIDPAIVRRQLHTGGMTFKTIGEMTTVRDDHEASSERDRRGIPQGSVISPLVADHAMAAVLQDAAVFEALPLFVWSDNVGIIIPRVREREIGDLVRAAFADHGAGPFQLTSSSYPVMAPFKFLGVWYRKTPVGADAFVPWEVVSRWELSVGARLMTCWDDEIDAIERAVAEKMSKWSWCPSARETVSRLKAMIASRRETAIGSQTPIWPVRQRNIA
ncbi:hypothetical protein SKP52_09735 [Sphingopyxis fribergensis]|uniref:Reverse transcriptase domain-containing protein n=1 Tax=Sphingopyxis fribergensis TaxID=1515612 RepID=A0A0A7PFS5_9SPHN|nr:reverse transcriptase domain-containing protein [Sphingopyxis fribergensis]AJA08855.1 hypothetical protein SKP52_09735 [Sphingopyxis fribergensis]